MASWPSTVLQEWLSQATGLLQGIRQDRQVLEAALVVDGLGNLRDCAVVPGEPGRIDGKGLEGVAEGTPVAMLFEQRMPGRKPEDYLIRVNRLPVSHDRILQEGDRISMTPTKIEGAA